MSTILPSAPAVSFNDESTQFIRISLCEKDMIQVLFYSADEIDTMRKEACTALQALDDEDDGICNGNQSILFANACAAAGTKGQDMFHFDVADDGDKHRSAKMESNAHTRTSRSNHPQFMSRQQRQRQQGRRPRRSTRTSSSSRPRSLHQ
mmetsp:Transcript_5065/g.8974  ORF Transcript_5065/g.8974 Transcript_5065/m.8974 type:complete len:150 (+) Transcript_5065:175-624(+)